MDELKTLEPAWKESAIDPRWFGTQVDLLVEPERLSEETLRSVEHTEALARFTAEQIAAAPLRAAIFRDPSSRLFAKLEQQLTAAWQAQLEQRNQFADLTLLDLDAWQQASGGTLEGLIARNRAALEQPDRLTNWLDYVRVRRQPDTAGFAPLTKAVEQGRIALNDIDAGYELGLYDLLAQQIFTVLPDLARFSGNAQLAVQKEFREYDEKLKQLQRERISWTVAQHQPPPGTSGNRVGDDTELALLQHECGKKKQHIPLRQLVARAGNAMAALKPCFMMGPMAVAQYLPAGEMKFDLVVMDEASQMRLENALGAIARGRQLVVVGDSKQLPPSSLFAKMIADEEEENTTGIIATPSILETVGRKFPARHLRWHYRSQHENLIAFSNHAFYDDQLVLFPSPHSQSAELGVKLTRVPRGRCVNGRNLKEARVIALAAQRHLLQRPSESLGIVAMTTEQRDRIGRALEELANEDPLLRKALEENLAMEEPLFIKYLENIQGDERDVIFISCTYGPAEVGGRVEQRFGSIDSDAGWRRLNVLLTRAKKRMHLFSSMGAEEIEVSQRSKRGVSAFKELLSFAETGHIQHSAATDQAADSDFALAVAADLGREGFESVPRVGVAGFFIDLAVRDPRNPDRYLLGIECDGPSYLSAKSVRDRDRLRQTVLEQLGWRIRRIWSPDWYKDPRAQIEQIVHELNELLNTPNSAPPGQTPETAEISELAEIVAREDQQGIWIDAAVSAHPDLSKRLLRFDRDIIRSELPDTPESRRLLRPAMLEALLEQTPATKSEFVERVPMYLRQATGAHESSYLEQVLKIIEASEIDRT